MVNFLSQFMKEHFDNLTLRPPLFYSWEYGIRFEISMPWVQHEDKNNLQQIDERINGIFNKVFHNTDEMLLVTFIVRGMILSCNKKDPQKSTKNI